MTDDDLNALLMIRLYLKRRRRSLYIRTLFKKRKECGQYNMLVPQLIEDSELFFNYFRMSKSRLEELLKLVGPRIQHAENHAFPIGAGERLCLTLRILASGDSQASMAFNYRMSKSSISNIVKETSSAIWDALQPVYLPPPTIETFEQIAKEFWKEWNFPNCLGALDGKHVVIVAPPNSGSQFFNYKKQHSIVLMALVDARYKFIFVDIGAQGHCSDSTVFSESYFWKAISENRLEIPGEAPLPHTTTVVPYMFIADEGFPLKTNMMRPYPSRDLDDSKRIFNYRLSRARRTVENAFGILVARWRIFRKPVEAYTAVNDMLKASVCLHNYLADSDHSVENCKRYIPRDFVDREMDDGIVVPGNWRTDAQNAAFSSLPRDRFRNYQKKAGEIRDDLKFFFCSNEGRVSWQDKVLGIKHD